jgi:hypothetical protein
MAQLIDGVVGSRRHEIGIKRRAVAKVLGSRRETCDDRVCRAPLQRFFGNVTQSFRRSKSHDVGALAAQGARNERCLDGGNAAGDQERDAPPLQMHAFKWHVMVAER